MKSALLFLLLAARCALGQAFTFNDLPFLAQSTVTPTTPPAGTNWYEDWYHTYTVTNIFTNCGGWHVEDVLIPTEAFPYNFCYYKTPLLTSNQWTSVSVFHSDINSFFITVRGKPGEGDSPDDSGYTVKVQLGDMSAYVWQWEPCWTAEPTVLTNIVVLPCGSITSGDRVGVLTTTDGSTSHLYFWCSTSGLEWDGPQSTSLWGESAPTFELTIPNSTPSGLYIGLGTDATGIIFGSWAAGDFSP